MTRQEQALQLIARIDAHLNHFSGGQDVPYSQRHRIKLDPLTGSPEPTSRIFADVRRFLTGEVVS